MMYTYSQRRHGITLRLSQIKADLGEEVFGRKCIQETHSLPSQKSEHRGLSN